MSEYWKSTPKYWCKHCKTFVRDTKLEKQNHEATPRHQGNLSRFLRDLHRGHERDERDKQRAKNEVDRLNGVQRSETNQSQQPDKKFSIPKPSGEKGPVSHVERKKQLAQLAELGVAVPEDYRREMAMAGDWQTMSIKPTFENEVMREEIKEDQKVAATELSKRKRRFENHMEEDGEHVAAKDPKWGSATRGFPDAQSMGDTDLDSLLGSVKVVKPKAEITEDIKTKSIEDQESKTEQGAAASDTMIKSEEPQESSIEQKFAPDDALNVQMKQEDTLVEPGVVFKKRKAKSTRQKS